MYTLQGSGEPPANHRGQRPAENKAKQGFLHKPVWPQTWQSWDPDLPPSLRVTGGSVARAESAGGRHREEEGPVQLPPGPGMWVAAQGRRSARMELGPGVRVSRAREGGWRRRCWRGPGRRDTGDTGSAPLVGPGQAAGGGLTPGGLEPLQTTLGLGGGRRRGPDRGGVGGRASGVRGDSTLVALLSLPSPPHGRGPGPPASSALHGTGTRRGSGQGRVRAHVGVGSGRGLGLSPGSAGVRVGSGSGQGSGWGSGQGWVITRVGPGCGVVGGCRLLILAVGTDTGSGRGHRPALPPTPPQPESWFCATTPTLAPWAHLILG